MGKMKRTKSWASAAVVLLAAAVLAVPAAAAFGRDRGPDVRAELDAYQLDPVAYALGVRDHESASRLAAARNGFEGRLIEAAARNPLVVELASGQITADQLRGVDVGLDESDIKAAELQLKLEDATDELYAQLALTSEAQDLAKVWQVCMVKAGIEGMTSPMDIEAEISLPPDQQTYDERELLNTRDQCIAESETDVELLLLGLLPDWVEENRDLVNAYGAAIGFKNP